MGRQALFPQENGFMTWSLDTISKTGQFYEKDRKLEGTRNKV